MSTLEQHLIFHSATEPCVYCLKFIILYGLRLSVDVKIGLYARVVFFAFSIIDYSRTQEERDPLTLVVDKTPLCRARQPH